MNTLSNVFRSIQGDKLLLAAIFFVMLTAIFAAQHVHNETLIQWLLQTAGQVLAALLALLVHDNKSRATDSPKEGEQNGSSSSTGTSH